MLLELRRLTLNQRVLHISEALGLSSARVGLEKRDSCFVIHSFFLKYSSSEDTKEFY